MKITRTIEIEVDSPEEASKVDELIGKMTFKGKGILWIKNNLKNPLFGSKLRDMVKIRAF